MKTKILGFALFLTLVAGICYLMAAGTVPTQPKVGISQAVESAWDRYIQYSCDLTVGQSLKLNTGGIDTIKIAHVESLDTNSSGIHYPFHLNFKVAADSNWLGQFTDFLGIGMNHALGDTLKIYNPSTTDTISVEILLIGTSAK